MLLYQHVLQDLRLAGLTDIITDAPCDFTQRQERNPLRPPPKKPEAALATRGEASVPHTRPAGMPPASRQVAEKHRPALATTALPLVTPVAALDMGRVMRTQTHPHARAWVVLVDNDLSDNFYTTPVGITLGKMMAAIGLTTTEVNLLRFAEVHQGHRLSTAHVQQLGEAVTPVIKQTLLPVLMLGQAAVQVLWGHDKPMAALQGKRLDLPMGLQGVATYHPSLLTLQADTRQRVWDALRLFQPLITTDTQ